MSAQTKTLVTNVRVFDGESFLPQLQNVLIADGAVEKVTTASGTAAQEQELAASDVEVIDALHDLRDDGGFPAGPAAIPRRHWVERAVQASDLFGLVLHAVAVYFVGNFNVLVRRGPRGQRGVDGKRCAERGGGAPYYCNEPAPEVPRLLIE